MQKNSLLILKKQKMKKVKNILFRIKMKGNGIVNFDSSEQRFMYNGTNLHNMKTMHENTSYAKKKFYKDGENLNYKISISSDCLRHEAFKDDVLVQSPNIINDDVLLYSFIASPASIIRGYLFANKKETLKRKGALTITDAEQTCNAVSYIETFSRSGFKNQDEDKTDNSFYKKEVIGNIEYETIGNIDLMQLQFVGCDQIFDRYAFNPDKFNVYKQFLKTKLPGFDAELSYYSIKNSIVELSEYGYKMNNENILTLVRELFERLLKMNIKRKGSYAEVSKLEYKLVYDVIDDTFESEDGWNEISDRNDISSISFETEDFYIQEDTEAAKLKRADMDADYEKRKAEDKEKKAAKTKNKKKNKEESDTLSDEEKN